MLLDLVGLLSADALLASIVRRLLVDLLKRRLVFGGNLRLLAREDLAGLCGKLRAKRRDGRLDFTEFGVVGIEIALGLFKAIVLSLALFKNTVDLLVRRRQLCVEVVRLLVLLLLRKRRRTKKAKLFF